MYDHAYFIARTYNTLDARPARSAWDRGVKQYAYDLLNVLTERIEHEQRTPANSFETLCWMLNGANNWQQYSYGGCALIYDSDIAARLCTPSELRKTNNGRRRPNTRESWLDVQARALCQASHLIYRCIPAMLCISDIRANDAQASTNAGKAGAV